MLDCVDILDTKNIRKDANILILGKRGCGKSKLATSLIKQIFDFNDHNKGLVFSFYEKFSGYYFNALPDVKIKNDMNTITYHEMLNEENYFVIFDECFVKDQSYYFEQCLENKNQLNIFICTYPKQINKQEFQKFDYIFTFNETNQYDLKIIYNNIFNQIENFELFNIIFDKCTENFSTLVKSKRDNKYYWYNSNMDGSKKILYECPKENVMNIERKNNKYCAII